MGTSEKGMSKLKQVVKLVEKMPDDFSMPDYHVKNEQMKMQAVIRQLRREMGVALDGSSMFRAGQSWPAPVATPMIVQPISRPAKLQIPGFNNENLSSWISHAELPGLSLNGCRSPIYQIPTAWASFLPVYGMTSGFASDLWIRRKFVLQYIWLER